MKRILITCLVASSTLPAMSQGKSAAAKAKAPQAKSSASVGQAKLVEKVTPKGDEFVIPYEKYVLPNGLTVIVHEDRSDPVVHVDVTYHVGSAREEIGKSGFAHFFEHMMFQGSDNVGDDQHFKIVTESGGTLNGSTNRDRTNYYQTVPSNQLEKMLWLEADRMGFLLDAVDQRKFENQRSTVKNERGQNYDNRPYGLVGEFTSKNLYPYGHPYSWMTIGYLEDLNRSDVNDLKNFFLRWYGPNNATLTVGGDVDAKEVVRLAQKYFGSIPRGPEVKSMKLDPVKLEKNRYVSMVDNYARTPQLQIVYPTVPSFHKDETALDCLAEVLGQGRNSILFQNMVKNQKARAASAGNRSSELAGEFVFSVSPFPGKSLAEMEKLVNEALADFEKRGVTDDDIEKFKSSNEASTITRLESVSNKVSRLAAYETFTGNPNKIKDELQSIRSLTKADVMRVYNQYIKGKNRLVVSVLTQGTEELVAAPDNYTIDTTNYKPIDHGYKGLTYVKAKDNFDRKKMPGNGPNPVVNLPAVWKKELQNGMKVIGTENTEVPVVTLQISLKGGKLLEAKDVSEAGLSSLFASMMNEDTKNYSSEDFSLELQKLGSSIRVFSGTDAIVFSVQSLKKNLDKTLALLEERMLRPNFTEEDFARVKKQTLEGIVNSKRQATSVANEVYAKVNYGSNHVLALPTNGTVESVTNMRLNNIQHFYDNFITSEDGRVVVVGDIKESEVLPKLSFLNKLPKKSFNIPTIPPAPAVEKTRIYIVDIPRSAQTEFRVGYPTALRYDATGDYYRAYLTNYNLGQAFSSRLNLNLREDKGWTYGARSGFAADKYAGTFTFSSGIRADATDSALSEVIREIKEYTATGIRQEELDFMRSSIGQAEARQYETGVQKASFINRLLEYNLPADYVRQQNQIVKTISKKDIDATAKKYLDVNKMNIVLVGDKSKIMPGLQRLGYEIVELDADGNVKK
ncbi:M16 family metallopeptidase [Aridibaculum aurantiacum]|uniref:M16 family metallopeptidase n=1 Tax=Aridibaculum aurantiacum TaxID=2810307 RepID=UPI001A95EC75|nr:pitrilysin family protein [Aridibaculum aurantiacum]